MKYLWTFGLLALALFAFSGCATTGSTASGGEQVPGEAKSEESRLQPGAGTSPSASVKW